MSFELETINKLYLELSQIATAKTKREIELENEISSTPDLLNQIAHLFLFDKDLGWAEISSGLNQDFVGGFNSFNIRYRNGDEFKITFKVKQLTGGG